MITGRRVLIATLLGATTSGAVASCAAAHHTVDSPASVSLSSGDAGGPPPPSGGITVQQNYQVTQGNSIASGWVGYHETTIAPAMYNGGNGYTARWVMGFNAGPQNTIGWAYSSDISGSSWTVEAQDGGAYGDPCGGGSCMADGHKFLGMGGDPSMATVTNPATNGNTDASTTGLQVVYTQLANSTANGYTDIAVAISNNGGQTFGHPHLLTAGIAGDGGTGALGSNNGSGVDNAVIASHNASPYSIFATWTVNAASFVGSYITQVSYGTGFSFGALTPLPNAQIRSATGGGTAFHPTVAMGLYKGCDGEQHEVAYVAWTTQPSGVGCLLSPDGGPPWNVEWWLDAFDTNNGVQGSGQHWLSGGPWKIDSDPTWPGCVGNDVDGGENFGDNDARPRLAVEPDNDNVWIALNHSSVYGARTKIWQFTLVCTDSSYGLGTGNPAPWTPPPYCFAPNSVCTNSPGDGGPPYNNGTGNGYAVNDQWGPAIAFVRNPTTGKRRLAATWFDTTNDPLNNTVTLEGAYQEANAIDLTMTRVTVGIASTTPPGQTVPWNHTVTPWWDYQALASETASGNYTFLGAWPDGRLCTANPCGVGPTAPAGIWSAVLQ